MKKPVTNVAESVRARLLNLRTTTGEEFNELLVRFCLERLLYRLSISPHREEFILKGAMLFALWQGFMHRRTRDLDLLGFGDPTPEAVAAVFREIVSQTVPVDDGIVFDEATVEAATIKAQDEYIGARVKLCAFIGKARIWLQIDVGYGDSITPEPLERAYPGLLDFPQALLRCYAPETALAEKFEAVVNLGLVNSRMKDYFDFWTIGHQFPFDGTIMADTIRNTFAKRGTPVPASAPAGLSKAFWSDSSKPHGGPSGKSPSCKTRCSIWKPSSPTPLRYCSLLLWLRLKASPSPPRGSRAGRGINKSRRRKSVFGGISISSHGGHCGAAFGARVRIAENIGAARRQIDRVILGVGIGGVDRTAEGGDVAVGNVEIRRAGGKTRQLGQGRGESQNGGW